MKLLVWALVAALIVFWIFLSRKKQKAARRPPPASASASASRGDAGNRNGEAMIPCTRCGVHLPYSEAVIGATGVPFCSDEHRLQHERH